MLFGEWLLGLDLVNGGYLIYGMWLNFFGKFYENGFYGVDLVIYLIDMDVVWVIVFEFCLKVIIVGWLVYLWVFDFVVFWLIVDEVGVKLFVDMVYFVGLVVVGLYLLLVLYVDVVFIIVYKMFGGGCFGLIVGKQQYVKVINLVVFFGQQGGLFMYVIVGKVVVLKIVVIFEFVDWQWCMLFGVWIIVD